MSAHSGLTILPPGPAAICGEIGIGSVYKCACVVAHGRRHAVHICTHGETWFSHRYPDTGVTA